MNRRNLCAAALAMPLAALGSFGASTAQADPFVLVTMGGRQHGTSDPFQTHVLGSPGSVIDYVVGLEMFNVGHFNSNAGGHTFLGPSFGVDGINSLSFDLFELATQEVQVDFTAPATLTAAWGAGSGATGGTLTPRSNAAPNRDLAGIHVQRSPGVFGALSGEAVAMGSFTVTKTSIIQVAPMIRWADGGTGLIKINGNTLLTIDSITELGSDPYVAYGPPLAIGYIPEPTTGIAASGLACLLLTRRRRGEFNLEAQHRAGK